jgi:KaiC/GvpD/RAD55 family RecA-like ATPase
MSGFRDRAALIASLQTRNAIKLLDRTESDFLQMPWKAVDAAVSGIAEGDIWFIGGFSGDGKTTALTSAVDRWYEQGKRIYYLGLESRPKILLTHWACKRVGIDAGEVLSGLALRWHDWKERKAELTAMIRSLEEGGTEAQVHFSPTEFVDGHVLAETFHHAKEYGADLLVIDHIDHIDGDRGSPFEVSREVCSVLMREAQSKGIRCLVATQFNNEALKGNKLGRYLPPQPNYVYMGGHKRQIASGMLGLYRPLKHNLEPEVMREFQRGMLEPKDVCEPHTMGCVVMKHRLFGGREGNRIYLGLERGKVIDLPEHDQPNTHGIRTARFS